MKSFLLPCVLFFSFSLHFILCGLNLILVLLSCSLSFFHFSWVFSSSSSLSLSFLSFCFSLACCLLCFSSFLFLPSPFTLFKTPFVSFPFFFFFFNLLICECSMHHPLWCCVLKHGWDGWCLMEQSLLEQNGLNGLHPTSSSFCSFGWCLVWIGCLCVLWCVDCGIWDNPFCLMVLFEPKLLFLFVVHPFHQSHSSLHSCVFLFLSLHILNKCLNPLLFLFIPPCSWLVLFHLQPCLSLFQSHTMMEQNTLFCAISAEHFLVVVFWTLSFLFVSWQFLSCWCFGDVFNSSFLSLCQKHHSNNVFNPLCFVCLMFQTNDRMESGLCQRFVIFIIEMLQFTLCSQLSSHQQKKHQSISSLFLNHDDHNTRPQNIDCTSTLSNQQQGMKECEGWREKEDGQRKEEGLRSWIKGNQQGRSFVRDDETRNRREPERMSELSFTRVKFVNKQKSLMCWRREGMTVEDVMSFVFGNPREKSSSSTIHVGKGVRFQFGIVVFIVPWLGIFVGNITTDMVQWWWCFHFKEMDTSDWPIFHVLICHLSDRNRETDW